MKQEYKNLLLTTALLLGALLLSASCASKSYRYDHGKNYTENPQGTSWVRY